MHTWCNISEELNPH